MFDENDEAYLKELKKKGIGIKKKPLKKKKKNIEDTLLGVEADEKALE